MEQKTLIETTSHLRDCKADSLDESQTNYKSNVFKTNIFGAGPCNLYVDQVTRHQFPAPVLHHPQGTNVGRRALDRVSHHLGAPRLQAPSRSRRATFTNGHIIYGPLKLPFCRKNAPIESAKEEVETCSPGSYALFLFASPPTCLFPSPTCHPARCKFKQVVAICGIEHWIHVAHETPCMSFREYSEYLILWGKIYMTMCILCA